MHELLSQLKIVDWLMVIVSTEQQKCLVQIVVIDEDPNPNISTFRPLDQMINSNIKYNGDNTAPQSPHKTNDDYDGQVTGTWAAMVMFPVSLNN